jgi:hypothetical protein
LVRKPTGADERTGELRDPLVAALDTRETIADLAKQLLDLDEGELSRHERHIIQKAVKRLAVARDVGLEFTRDMTCLPIRWPRSVAPGPSSWDFSGSWWPG